MSQNVNRASAAIARTDPLPIAASRPQDFYEALDRHPSADPLIVDFDETLWLRNSTEMFLDSVRPRFLAAMVLQLLGFIRPWRMFRNGDHYRDWVRVIAVLFIAPWSLWRWRRMARELGPRYLNRPLLAAIALEHRQGVGLVTFGFREIVRPLLDVIAPAFPLSACCSLRDGATLRIEGKASALRKRYGDDWLGRSLAITDSIVDSDLLEAAGKPFLVEWPDARYEQAGLNPLMPFVYLQRVKRPDENYLRNAILGHDLPVLILAYAVVSAHPLLATASILLYVMGFFTSYEVGYHENDRLGLKLESKPKVSANFHQLEQNFSPPFAWAVAIALTGLASLFAYEANSWIPDVLGDQGISGFFAVWGAFVAFLLVMRLLFRWQNVIEPQGRIVPMLFLQVGRVLGYAVILPTTVIGGLFCVAHGLSRWLPYVIYRFGGSRRDVPNHLNCFLLLMLFAFAVLIGGGFDRLLNWQAALIFGYAGLRAAKDLLSFSSKLTPLSGRTISPGHEHQVDQKPNDLQRQ